MAARRRSVARARGRQRRLLALIAIGTLGALGLLWWLANGPLLAVNHVTVRGYDRPDLPALQAAIDEAAAQGTIASPAVDEVRRAAAAFPWVSAVSVQRDWPRGLTVDAAMARPAAAAAAAEGAAALVSSEGRVLGPVPDGAGVGWMRLPDAPPPAGYALPESGRAALAFLAAAPPEAGRRVRRLGLDATGALSGMVEGGPVLILGRPVDLTAKARGLALVLSQVPATDLEAATYIDLRVARRPSVGGLGAPADASAAGGTQTIE